MSLAQDSRGQEVVVLLLGGNLWVVVANATAAAATTNATDWLSAERRAPSRLVTAGCRCHRLLLVMVMLLSCSGPALPIPG